jgi:hypothetical protein
MGRGAHPDSFADRLAWPLSPWTRRRFVRAGIRLEPEVSFQGGDGYLFFGTPELALATLTRFAEMPPGEADADAPADPFYRRTDLSLDFYRAIRRCSGRATDQPDLSARGDRLRAGPAQRYRQPQVAPPATLPPTAR